MPAVSREAGKRTGVSSWCVETCLDKPVCARLRYAANDSVDFLTYQPAHHRRPCESGEKCQRVRVHDSDLARASAPSRHRRCARWRAQRSSAVVYGSGSSAIRFETARERRRRHRRSAPARHRWKDTVAFHGCCEMLNTAPHLALPHVATRPPPHAPRSRDHIEGVSRHSRARAALGRSLLARLRARTLPAPDSTDLS